MTDSMMNRIEALRNEAYQALQESEAFRAFKALDEAVGAMGGNRHLYAQGSFAMRTGITINGAPIREAVRRPDLNPPPRKRVSQAEAAEMVLKEKRRPMTSAELLTLVPEKGVTVGGEKPLMSFGSTLSRDPRFVNIRHEGLYYWWLKALGPPPEMNEAPDLLREDGSDASSSISSQEGGEGHAPATT